MGNIHLHNDVNAAAVGQQPYLVCPWQKVKQIQKVLSQVPLGHLRVSSLSYQTLV